MFAFIKKILLYFLVLLMPNATICNDAIIETPTVGISSETLVDHEYLDVFIGGSSNSEVFVKGLKFSEESGYSKVEHIVIPDEINGYPVTTICDMAFFNEGGYNSLDFIKSVKIGDNVRYIGHCAFLDSHIESIELGKNVEILEQGAFECCYSLNEIELNDNLRVIKGSSLAFGDYFNSTYIPQIPESVEYIDSYCFGGVRRTDSFVISNGLKYWGGNIVRANKLVVLSIELNFGEEDIINPECIVYCYENSTIHQKLKSGEITNEYHLIENAYLTSETVDISEDYVISGLQGGLTENDLKSCLNVVGEAEIRASDEVVKTGTRIELVNTDPEFVYKTYTAVVDGDINGDGASGAAEDFTAMREIITGSDSEYSEINKQAADLNGDGIVNSTDLTIMKSLLS